MSRDLSIIIVFSLEDKSMLFGCLEAIEKSCLGLSHESILVNNNKESPDFIMRRFPDMQIVDNGGNHGIGRARNQGVKKAGGNVLLFIDPDILVQEETIPRMYEYLSSHPDIAGLAPRVVSPDGQLHHNFGSLPSLLYPMIELCNFPMDRKKKAVQGISPFLGGGGLMIRRVAWERVGEFDESFFYGFEDTDWSLRALRKRIKLLYFPKALVIHFLHQAVEKSGARQIDFYISEIYYYKKHYGEAAGFLVEFFIIGFSGLRYIVTFLGPGRSSTRQTVRRLLKRLLF